jgi:hypothetical protein
LQQHTKKFKELCEEKILLGASSVSASNSLDLASARKYPHILPNIQDYPGMDLKSSRKETKHGSQSHVFACLHVICRYLMFAAIGIYWLHCLRLPGQCQCQYVNMILFLAASVGLAETEPAHHQLLQLVACQ